MSQQIGQISILVDEYDIAIDFYVHKLGFELVEDTALSETKRWVVVAPKGSPCSLLLARAVNKEQKSRIGNQTGGRVFLFLYTDDIKRDHEHLLRHNIDIVRQPVRETWGTVLVFRDAYGNLWDLIQRC